MTTALESRVITSITPSGASSFVSATTNTTLTSARVQDVRQSLNDTSYVVIARDTRQLPEISFMDVNRGLMRKRTVRKVGAQ